MVTIDLTTGNEFQSSTTTRRKEEETGKKKRLITITEKNAPISAQHSTTLSTYLPIPKSLPRLIHVLVFPASPFLLDVSRFTSPSSLIFVFFCLLIFLSNSQSSFVHFSHSPFLSFSSMLRNSFTFRFRNSRANREFSHALSGISFISALRLGE